jgi:hypothetical protein
MMSAPERTLGDRMEVRPGTAIIAPLREVIAESAAGRTEQGFTKLDEYGAVWEEEDKEKRLATIAEKHLEAIAGGKTALIVSPTHGTRGWWLKPLDRLCDFEG